MFPNKKIASSPCISEYGPPMVSGESNHGWTIDREFYEQQCALLERNEQAARRRAHENEYWRQRTLARRFQTQSVKASYPGLAALDDDDAHLEATDVKHRTGEILNVFMDEYNRQKPSARFFDWVCSMTPKAQTRMIERAMEDAGYSGIIRPAWVRAFNRGISHMNAGERSSYQIEIRDGLLYQNGVKFDTSNMKTQQSGSGVAFYIQSVDGTFYSSSHLGGRLVSPSPQTGDLCESTGEWKVERGRIEWVRGKGSFDRLPTTAHSQAMTEL